VRIEIIAAASVGPEFLLDWLSRLTFLLSWPVGATTMMRGIVGKDCRALFECSVAMHASSVMVRVTAMTREDLELLTELSWINNTMTSLALWIIKGSATADEQRDYAQRLIAGVEAALPSRGDGLFGDR
jgi:hypothetical protein